VKIPNTKYELRDQVLVEGSYIEIERVLTIKAIQVRVNSDGKIKIVYEFDQSQWMHEEDDIIKKIECK